MDGHDQRMQWHILKHEHVYLDALAIATEIDTIQESVQQPINSWTEKLTVYIN